MIADVDHAGTIDCVHYWNRLACGLELDLTREQFLPQETLAYLLLRRRVLTTLGVEVDGR